MYTTSEVKREYHKTLNTFHLFESFLYGEFYHTVNEVDKFDEKYLESLENNEFYIDKNFIINVFNEVWEFSDQIDTNPRISENYITEILNDTDEDEDFFQLTMEFGMFDCDFKTLEQIKDYSLKLIERYGNKIKMKYFFRNYLNILKANFISNFKIKLLVCKENISLN
jgi:hypothetical protein